MENFKFFLARKIILCLLCIFSRAYNDRVEFCLRYSVMGCMYMRQCSEACLQCYSACIYSGRLTNANAFACFCLHRNYMEIDFSKFRLL